MKRPKGYLKWVKKLEHPSPSHYTMEYDAADGYTGTQLMQFIKYMKSKHERSCLIGPNLVYCLMDRIAALEAKE